MSVDVPRRIVLLRHAKADWPQVPDHERPLAERGRKDAPAAGRWLAGAGVAPDLTLCSTAARARETWKLFAPELPERPRTVYDERLYEATLGELIAVINGTDDAVKDLMLVGHNPAVHALADALAGASDGDTRERMNRGGYPTSSLAVLSLSGDWKAVEHGSARLVAFWSPQS
ncbi:SixA phosphatase family protein [Streptomyces radicis]|uniref:Histidine phosphatase family protein n=1 Tax=Streptomyces radicis TaxID=1750517 RepID=A0A3A9VSC6_9ACTN|nr:histidine phosphatase family protein [Streptomyces radicis]RKN03925.1 histidine phosphatase family protein [Streptomyces radicis]RKN14135.1 histidine phosphatase family protein [Streptomyces radicis]